jgi:hypothetical protein
MNGSDSNPNKQSHLMVKFFTKSQKYRHLLSTKDMCSELNKISFQSYKVPDNPISIPSNSTPNVLNDLIKELIGETKIDEDFTNEFTFLINNEYLQTSLEEFLNQRPEIKTVSACSVMSSRRD